MSDAQAGLDVRTSTATLTDGLPATIPKGRANFLADCGVSRSVAMLWHRTLL